MKSAVAIATLLLLGPVSSARTAQQEDPPDLTVAAPLLSAERTAAARLSRLPGTRLAWNDENRIVGVELKGRAAHDQALAWSAQLPGLRSLVIAPLPENRLTQNGLAPLAHHRSLRLLSISGDRPGDAALVHLQSLNTLEILILQGNFTDAGMQLIAHLSNLHYLDLTQCRVTTAGLEHLGEMASLKTLILNGTGIQNDSLQPLVQCKTLIELYLRDTTINDGAIEHLQQMEQLKKLILLGTDVTQEGIDRLLPQLPADCRVIHEGGTQFGKRDPRIASAERSSGSWKAAR